MTNNIFVISKTDNKKTAYKFNYGDKAKIHKSGIKLAFI